MLASTNLTTYLAVVSPSLRSRQPAIQTSRLAGYAVDEVVAGIVEKLDLADWTEMGDVFSRLWPQLVNFNIGGRRDMFDTGFSIVVIGQMVDTVHSLLEDITAIPWPKTPPKIPIKLIFSPGPTSQVSAALRQQSFWKDVEDDIYANSDTEDVRLPDIQKVSRAALELCNRADIDLEADSYFHCALNINIQGPRVPRLRIVSLPPRAAHQADDHDKTAGIRADPARRRENALKHELGAGLYNVEVAAVVVELLTPGHQSQPWAPGRHSPLVECEEPACQIFSFVDGLTRGQSLQALLPPGNLDAAMRATEHDRNAWFAASRYASGEVIEDLPRSRAGTAKLIRSIARLFRERLFERLAVQILALERAVQFLERCLVREAYLPSTVFDYGSSETKDEQDDGYYKRFIGKIHADFAAGLALLKEFPKRQLGDDPGESLPNELLEL